MDIIENKRRQITANVTRDLLTVKEIEAQMAFACGRERELILADCRYLTAKIDRDTKRAKVFTAAALEIIELQQATPPTGSVN